MNRSRFRVDPQTGLTLALWNETSCTVTKNAAPPNVARACFGAGSEEFYVVSDCTVMVSSEELHANCTFV